MAKSLLIDVKPNVLRWARTNSGYSIEKIAAKLKIDPELINEWEHGEESISISLTYLKKLASYYKRPLAALLISNPPDESAYPPDFRMFKEKGDEFSPDTILAIRQAKQLQVQIRELTGMLDNRLVYKQQNVTITDNPEIIAQRVRKQLYRLSRNSDGFSQICRKEIGDFLTGVCNG